MPHNVRYVPYAVPQSHLEGKLLKWENKKHKDRLVVCLDIRTLKRIKRTVLLKRHSSISIIYINLLIFNTKIMNILFFTECSFCLLLLTAKG